MKKIDGGAIKIIDGGTSTLIDGGLNKDIDGGIITTLRKSGTEKRKCF